MDFPVYRLISAAANSAKAGQERPEIRRFTLVFQGDTGRKRALHTLY